MVFSTLPKKTYVFLSFILPAIFFVVSFSLGKLFWLLITKTSSRGEGGEIHFFFNGKIVE